MWNINYDTNTIFTFLQNRLRNTENKKEREWGRAKLGIWDQQIHTIIYKIDKQQGPSVQRWDYIQSPIVNHNRKDNDTENTYV